MREYTCPICGETTADLDTHFDYHHYYMPFLERRRGSTGLHNHVRCGCGLVFEWDTKVLMSHLEEHGKTCVLTAALAGDQVGGIRARYY